MATATPRVELLLPGRWSGRPLDHPGLVGELALLVERVTSRPPAGQHTAGIVTDALSARPDHVWIRLSPDEVTLLILSWPQRTETAGSEPVPATGVVMTDLPSPESCLAHTESIVHPPAGGPPARIDIVTATRRAPARVDDDLFGEIFASIRWRSDEHAEPTESPR